MQNIPWSFVVQFITSDGYLSEAFPRASALEPVIIEVLRMEFYASVPNIIAQNPELKCFFYEGFMHIITKF